MVETIISILLIAIGLWTFINPKASFNFKAKLVKSFGVTMTASPKSYKTMRYLGLAAAIVGFLMYFG